MRDDIRERIEAVRGGKVPKGYMVEDHQLRPNEWKYEKIQTYLIEHNEFSNDTEKYALATSSRQGLMLQDEYYSDQRYEKAARGFHVVPEGYITYRHMSDDDVFKFNLNILGCPVLVSPEYPVFTTKEGLKKEFLIEYLNGMRAFRAFCSAQKKGSTRTRMYFGRLGEFTMPIPSLMEQQKISGILATCDHVIELKQKLIEELQHLKKAFLTKMLPQNDVNVPEIRFPGFTSLWTQCKLGKLVRFSKGTGYSKAELKKTGTPIILYGRLYTNYETIITDVDTFVDAKSSSVYSHGGEVIVPASGETAEDIAIASVVENPGVLLGGDINIITPSVNLDSAFLAISITSGKPHKDIAKIAQGKSVVHLHNTDLEKIDLAYPSYEEQVCISAFFNHIDTSITLHRRELEAERQKKKALMQLLLTGLVRVNV